jgi:hypothetical protein
MIKVGTTQVVKQNANNSELQAAIEAVIPQAVEQTKDIANRYRGKTEAETCKKIFNYLKNQINYKADGAEQQVRLPSGLIRTLQGDCKSYAVFTSAILSNLGIPHSLVYTSYDEKDATPTHIYVVTDKGCIIDAVYGKFNAEKKPTYKKLKPMNISYIAGIKGLKKIGSMGRYGTGGACGIAGAKTGKQWAENLGIWDSLPGSLKALYYKNLLILVPYQGGCLFVRLLLKKNAGGLATSLNRLYEKAKADNSSPEFKKYRSIELEFLQKGGNPDELREAFQEGATKTPTGRYFHKLMTMKAGGYNPNIAQWIAAGVSLMFGKKYDPATGKITGGNSLGIGTEPATSAGLLANAPVWVQFVAYVTGVIGSAYIVGSVAGPNDIPSSENNQNNNNNNGGSGNNDGSGDGAGTSSILLPVLLVGGAAAAYFILKDKK